MVLSFGARNVFSFKEGFEINLMLDKNCPSEISNDKSFATIMALKGANASGKTSVLKTLNLIFEIGLDSFSYNPKYMIPFTSYFSNKESSDLFIIFTDTHDTFKYEIELTNQKILNESIYKNNILVIERKDNKFTHINDEYSDIGIIKLKDKASLISTAKQYEINSIEQISDILIRRVSNVNALGLKEELLNYKAVSKEYHEDKEVLNFAKHIIVNSDAGISDIIIEEQENIETNEKEYIPFFEYNINGEKDFLSYLNQSSGVKSLYKQLSSYQLVLAVGGILILDEFDINLHPDLLPLLLDLFDNPEKNIHDAQLIFTTHNTEIMEKLKKYRTILVNKEDNESFLYRLDELNGEVLRNDRPLTPIYNSGRIGGKPKPTL